MPLQTGQPADLRTLESHLPPAPKPVGSYVAAVQTGNLIFTSGCLPMENGQVSYTGPIGSISIAVEDGQAAARLCVLNALSVLKAELGSLARIRRIVKLTGFVASAPAFYEQPTVINGASDFLVEVFGEAGRHARSAVGVSNLPLDASVEVELIVEVE